MYVHQCYIYQDTEVTLDGKRGAVHIALEGGRMRLSASFSYSQAKVLADSLQSLLKQLPLRLLLTEEADLTGDMVAVATLEEESKTEENSKEKGEDASCQPMRLSAPMGTKSLLKIV
ncbi:MAG: hypothetical protein VB133_13040 [Anaeromusa sp.]|uniref:hypothetical protein n=1 Tax=Anaeromusa sp. TaxID=1872520 RepID=UPI002B1FAEAF|nr:hypothetical protein [Anaeromusa sp.]MEA4836043.1 hypothetical protein [Anaeromusa sp.]